VAGVAPGTPPPHLSCCARPAGPLHTQVTSRGGCGQGGAARGLSWGRIAAHQINAGARRFEWAAGAGPLRWAGDRELALELPAPLGAGFRVRAEWTGLVTAAGEALPPVRVVVALAPAAPWSWVPRVHLWPPPGPAPVDLRVELTADRPLARVEGPPREVGDLGSII
jgi:hypothetical protein